MTNLLGYRWSTPESPGSEPQETDGRLDAMRARGEVLLNTGNRAISRVTDPQRFLLEATQNGGQ